MKIQYYFLFYIMIFYIILVNRKINNKYNMNKKYEYDITPGFNVSTLSNI